jgi:hypothetical protein
VPPSSARRKGTSNRPLQTRKAELRHWGRQIVAGRLGKRQKSGIDLGADCMHPEILGSGIAATVAVKPGHRFGAALGERFAEYVAWLGHGCFSGKLG